MSEDERVAIVAGAAGELGRATATTLSDRGYTVVGVDRSDAGLKELPDGIGREVADTTDPDAARAVVDAIAEQAGPPAVLVNTVGAYLTGDAVDTTPEDWRLMLDVNLGPALWLSQAVAPYMQRRGSGVIVHVSGRPGVEPATGQAAYAVSKAALVHLTRVLDVELRQHGIRVNAVVPQLLDTARNRNFLPAELMAQAVAPQVIAELIAYLVSDSAAPVNGAIVPAYGN